MDTSAKVSNFYLKNCSLATIATGSTANSLLELREKLISADLGCIYHHFWGARMFPEFTHPQNHNDFARWIYTHLHDHVLAERLSIIDPTAFDNLEDLKQEVLEAIEKRIEENESISWTKKEDSFHFLSSIIIIFDSNLKISCPEDMLKIIPQLSLSSVFFHFIDARKRTPDKQDDFSVWMKNFGNKYNYVIDQIRSIDPYFLSLSQLKEELSKVIQDCFKEKEVR